MTVTSVRDLIQRGARAPGYLSAVDAVMGEEWAYIKLGEPRQALRMQYLLDRQRERIGRRPVSISAEVAQRSPQAMVKLIGKGGAADAAGLRAQMAYLGREGTVPLQRSDRYFGVEMDAEGRDALVAGWGLPETAGGKTDRTSHFVVSFPIGTPAAAAERAGRAWAETMFASGRFGDAWDYYTAFHTDTDHPHIHVVANRRGLEAGTWLKVSKRGEITFDVLREVQVEVAAKEGIHLVATPRLARGLHDRPVSDTEYRRAGREGRGVQPPAHTAETAAQTAAAVLWYARRYQADAELVAEAHEPLATALRSAASALKDGLAIQADRKAMIGDPEEVRRASDLVEAKRAEVGQLFSDIDREIGDLDDPAERARFQRSAAEIKAEAAALLPDREDLQAYRQPGTGRYAGIVAMDGRGREIKRQADGQVVKLEEEWRVRGDVMLARYGGRSVPAVLAREWTREEMADLAREHGHRGPLSPDDVAAFEPMIDARHQRIAAIYERAAQELAAHEARKAEVRALEPAEISADPRRFARLIRNVLTEQQRQQLEKGVVDALSDVTDDPADQARLGREYLRAAQNEASSTVERRRLGEALDAVDRVDGDNAEPRRRGRAVDRDDGHSL